MIPSVHLLKCHFLETPLTPFIMCSIFTEHPYRESLSSFSTYPDFRGYQRPCLEAPNHYYATTSPKSMFVKPRKGKYSINPELQGLGWKQLVLLLLAPLFFPWIEKTDIRKYFKSWTLPQNTNAEKFHLSVNVSCVPVIYNLLCCEAEAFSEWKFYCQSLGYFPALI